MNNIRKYLAHCLVVVLFLSGCTSVTVNPDDNATQGKSELSESDKANAFFERVFNEAVMRSPTFQSYLGIKKDQHKWDDISDANAIKEIEIAKAELQTLRDTININKLDHQTKISYRLFEADIERRIRRHAYRFHTYPINQMYGAQSQIPSFLINIHQVSEEKDADAYISRILGISNQIDEVIVNLKKREQMGVVAPKFVFAHAISDIDNVLNGKPFQKNAESDSELLADFRQEVMKLELPEGRSNELIQQAEMALATSVKPAFTKLKSFLLGQQQRATTDDGVWKLPDGAEFYRIALEDTTTTDMGAQEIHELGVREVARIHKEMREIMEHVEFDGTLQEFFEFMRTDPQFYYAESEAGKQSYLEEAEAMINIMKSRLDEVFITKPRADMEVKAVEAFREQSAGKAFYQRPAPDGSRPGRYYANLYRMSSMPIYQMEALAYHEGIPGHHMQIALAQEIEGIPSFRKFGSYTAYTEGWGLYSEYFPKEMGFYENPYSDFGRLAMELWRACRLVVDTGIHHKRWTREQAIEYLAENTPNPQADIVKAIERYIVMPSQATAYKIGMIKILQLRDRAKTALGAKFDIRQFHEVVLQNGPVPLSVLEELVDDYIEAKND